MEVLVSRLRLSYLSPGSNEFPTTNSLVVLGETRLECDSPQEPQAPEDQEDEKDGMLMKMPKEAAQEKKA